jgi:hypothetical protein
MGSPGGGCDCRPPPPARETTLPSSLSPLSARQASMPLRPLRRLLLLRQLTLLLGTPAGCEKTRFLVSVRSSRACIPGRQLGLYLHSFDGEWVGHASLPRRHSLGGANLDRWGGIVLPRGNTSALTGWGRPRVGHSYHPLVFARKPRRGSPLARPIGSVSTTAGLPWYRGLRANYTMF